MKHSDYVQNLIYDTRLIEWNVKNKIISQDEVSKHLKDLRDNQDNHEYIKIENLRYER